MADMVMYRDKARASAARAVDLDKRGMEIFNKGAREPRNVDEIDRGKSMCREAIDAYRTTVGDLMLLMKADKSPDFLARYKQDADGYLARMQYITKQLAEADAPVAEAMAGGGGGAHKGGAGGEDEKAKFKDAFSAAILPEKPNIPWTEIAGLEQAVLALKEIVTLPRKFPKLFHPHTESKPFGTVLLYGPPGTGKTYLAKAVATESDCSFFSIKTADLGSKWQSESEKLVHALFEVAREAANKPSAKYPGQKAGCVVFIDEIDAVCRKRSDGDGGGGGGGAADNKVLIQFLTELQGVGNNNDGVLFMGATNLPWQLDDAIIRRFEKKILIPLPETNARQQMFKLHMKKFRNNLEEWDFARLAELAEGKSGSDIYGACKEVSQEPMRKSRDASFFRISGARPAAPGGADTRTFEPLLDDPPCSACAPDIRTVNGRLVAGAGARSGPDAPPCRECGAVRMKMMDIPDGLVPEIGIVTMADFDRLIAKRGGLKGGVDMATARKFADWTAQFGEAGS